MIMQERAEIFDTITMATAMIGDSREEEKDDPVGSKRKRPAESGEFGS
jgi:hypothetical protein